MSQVDHIVRRVTAFTIDHAYPEIVELEIDAVQRQFGLADRVRKLKPGQSITMTITRKEDSALGEYVEMVIVDACTGKPSPLRSNK